MKLDEIIANSKEYEYESFNLFNLPIHNITLNGLISLLRSDVSECRPIVLSTINLNWVAESFRDSSFRKAICASDLVVLDGKPLLWIVKFLKYPFSETVPGSTLVQKLKEDANSDQPVSVFLFGGDNGIAEAAMVKVNKQSAGIKIVGAINPGFGTVSQMSDAGTIEKINKVKPDLLLVSLGAKKGMEWITYNKAFLNNVKVVSHLGATINFLAGTLKRAPVWMQNAGLEWLWRILQEPKLFWRYLYDGCLVFKVSIGILMAEVKTTVGRLLCRK